MAGEEDRVAEGVVGEPVDGGFPTCSECGAELVIGERALPRPLCATHEKFEQLARLRNEMAAIRLALQALEANVKELHETLEAHGIYHE